MKARLQFAWFFGVMAASACGQQDPNDPSSGHAGGATASSGGSAGSSGSGPNEPCWSGTYEDEFGRCVRIRRCETEYDCGEAVAYECVENPRAGRKTCEPTVSCSVDGFPALDMYCLERSYLEETKAPDVPRLEDGVVLTDECPALDDVLFVPDEPLGCMPVGQCGPVAFEEAGVPYCCYGGQSLCHGGVPE